MPTHQVPFWSNLPLPVCVFFPALLLSVAAHFLVLVFRGSLVCFFFSYVMIQIGSPVIGIPEVFRMRDGMVYSDVMRGYLSCSGGGATVSYGIFDSVMSFYTWVRRVTLFHICQLAGQFNVILLRTRINQIMIRP